MYSTEKIFDSMSLEDLHSTLEGFIDNDYCLSDFIYSQMLEDFLCLLELHDLVFVTSNERVLLTRKGEKILQQLNSMLI